MGEIFVTDTPNRTVSIRLATEHLVVTPPHFHPRHAESFYVLEGEMSFSVDGSELHTKAGSWVHVPPGAVHTFAFPGSSDVRFHSVHTPSCGWGTFLRALHNARNDDELVAARAAFDQEPAVAVRLAG